MGPEPPREISLHLSSCPRLGEVRGKDGEPLVQALSLNLEELDGLLGLKRAEEPQDIGDWGTVAWNSVSGLSGCVSISWCYCAVW